MDITKEKACLCALNRIFGFEPRIATALLSHFDRASEVFELNEKDISGILGPFNRFSGQIKAEKIEESADELIRLAGSGTRFVGWNEDWAASRFADVSGDAAPQAGQTVFVDGDVSFVKFLSKSSSLTVGGGAVFASSDGSITFPAFKLQVGLGATFKSKVTSTQASRVGAWARLTTFGAASATVDFDVASQADYFRFAAGELSTVPLYGRLELRPARALSIEIAGRYDCSSLTVIHQAGVADLRIKAESATFRAKTAAFTRSSESPIRIHCNYQQCFIHFLL